MRGERPTGEKVNVPLAGLPDGGLMNFTLTDMDVVWLSHQPADTIVSVVYQLAASLTR